MRKMSLAVAALAVGMATGQSTEAPKTPELQQISAAMRERWARIHSLSVEYRSRLEIIDTPENAKRYLGAEL